ncbi:MAG: porin PorA family protein [Thermoplasmatota archaeon]
MDKGTRRARRTSIMLLSSGTLMLLLALSWNPIIVPKVMEWRGEQQGDLEDLLGNGALMEGQIALPSIAWSSSDEPMTASEGEIPDITDDDLRPVWKQMEIRSDGIYEPGTGSLLFESPDQLSFEEGPSFPAGGLEKRDYRIFNPVLKRNVTAHYEGIVYSGGWESYSYSLRLAGERLEDMDSIPSSGGGGGAMSDFSEYMADGSFGMLYSDSTRYVLDPRTSIPVDLQLDLEVKMQFPDTTLLTVQEEEVRYSEEELWVRNDDVLGTREKYEVVKETRIYGGIDPEDRNIAVYQLVITYYDKNTGEVIDVQDPYQRETYAVDRSTYRYIPGYEGTLRTGLHSFPVGQVEERDYSIWDEISRSEGIAKYQGPDQFSGIQVMLFRMESKDIEVEAGNALFPVYRHPGTQYLMDAVQEWYLDSRTGFMVDYRIQGTIRVRNSGPISIVDEEVADFEVRLPDNTSSTLMEVSELYHELLIPLSNEVITVFGMKVSFTDDVKSKMVGVIKEVHSVLDAFQIWVPVSIASAGVVLIASGSLLLFLKSRRKTETYIATEL